jgi:hypothetical protein
MELTKEILEQTVKASEKRVIARIDEAQEELARITNNGLNDVLHRLDVRQRVDKLEKEMKELKTALNLT